MLLWQPLSMLSEAFVVSQSDCYPIAKRIQKMCAGRNASERRAILEKDDAQADPTAISGKAEMAGGDERRIRPAAAPGDWRRHVDKENEHRRPPAKRREA